MRPDSEQTQGQQPVLPAEPAKGRKEAPLPPFTGWRNPEASAHRKAGRVQAGAR